MKRDTRVSIKTEKEITLMQKAGSLVAEVLNIVEEGIVEGVSTMDLEKIAQMHCKKYNIVPAFLGYCGYPAILCISVNEEVVHGIPSLNKILNKGDVVSIDMGVCYNGYFGDSARTCIVGAVEHEVEILINQTKKALDIAITKMIDKGTLFELSSSIQNIAEEKNLGVVRQYSGHGIGKSLHEYPAIFNYLPFGYENVTLCTGMVFAIEPMFTLGSEETEVLDDGWTVVTKDGSIAAHFEHTVLITKDGPRILTI